MSETNAPTPLPPINFDPVRYLTRVNGADYLEVKWRLAWFRDRFPEGQIETSLIELREDWALFRATVTAVAEGGLLCGSATGYGSEAAGDFRDFIEKAESKAIGRALAHLGFGTQFVEGEAASGRIVDAPVQRAGGGRAAPPPRPIREAASARAPSAQEGGGPDDPATQRQLRYLLAVAREAGLSPELLDERSMVEFGVPAASLTRRDCSSLIDLLQTGGRQSAPVAAN